jgi:hypothetical protein
MLLSLVVSILCFALTQTAGQDTQTRKVHDRPYLEYGNVCWNDERARLDNFAFALATDPNAVGYVIVYDATPHCRREAVARAIRVRNYLVNYRGIEWNRVAWRYGGHRREFTVVAYVFPRDVRPPEWESASDSGDNKEDCSEKVYRRPRCPVR